jgi:cellobiose-specific phosphotransferase system component IIB
MDLRGVPPAAASVELMGEKGMFLVVPFEDLRPQKNRLGMRTHFWGGVTYFDVSGGKPGDLLAHVVAEYLKQKGWRAKVEQIGQTGVSESGGKPDVRLTGQVQEFSTNAKSRFGSTEITVKLKVMLQGVNASDGSTAKLTLEGTRTSTVIWFEPEDVQALVTATLKEGLEKLFGDVKVEAKSLRLK